MSKSIGQIQDEAFSNLLSASKVAQENIVLLKRQLRHEIKNGNRLAEALKYGLRDLGVVSGDMADNALLHHKRLKAKFLNAKPK